MTERDSRVSRRTLLGAGVRLAAAVGIRVLRAEGGGWDALPGILARIRAPIFPAREFDATRYGAVPGGKVDCGNAIAQAIEACHATGGGSVVIPAGTFLTGPIRLKSNVNLRLCAEATLLFSRDPQRYFPSSTRAGKASNA